MLKEQIRNSITRKELYDLIWSKPIMEISKDFGLSDRGLGKICERHDIPKPPRGYWQKLSAGEKIKIPKLPVIKDKWKEVITIRGSVETQLSDSLVKKIDEQTTESIVIPSKLFKPNPLIRSTEKTIKKELRQRRNLILHALFSALENKGHVIEIEEGFFKISYEKEDIYLNIFEHLKEHKRPLTEQEQKKKFYSVQKWHYEYESTGKIKINLHRFTPQHYSSWLIKSFMDSNNGLVETKINDIYLAIIEWLLIQREERLKKEEEKRIRKEKEKQVRIKNKKVEILLGETKSFILADNIRKYIKAKEKSFLENRVKMIDFEEWKNFAMDYANELDSAIKDEKGVVDDYVENPYW